MLFDAQRGLVLDVIGGTEPRWLCGSGLVSVVALMRRLGHLDDDGLLTESGPLEDHFFDDQGVRSVRLSEVGSHAETTSESATGVPSVSTEAPYAVTVTQLDIRAFQLAKAAVRSAIEAVSRDIDVESPCDVIIAGGFGAALSLDDLMALGVLPTEYAGRTRIVGNTSLLGAMMIAVDPSLEDQLSGIEARVEHMELALETGFAGRYLSGLGFGPWSLGEGDKHSS